MSLVILIPRICFSAPKSFIANEFANFLLSTFISCMLDPATSILRYLKGTTNQALCFGGSNISLQGYVDADMQVTEITGGALQDMYLLLEEQLSVGFQKSKVLLHFQQQKQSMFQL